MDSIVPQHMRSRQRQVEATIRDVFRGVTREGGISWTESKVMDDYGTDEECELARAEDSEPAWETLVDDPKWDTSVGIGGFGFLDAIGFRYYLAPALVRACRHGWSDMLAYHLDMSDLDTCYALQPSKWLLIDEAQSAAIAKAMQFLVEVFDAVDIADERDMWQTALDSYWFKFAGP